MFQTSDRPAHCSGSPQAFKHSSLQEVYEVQLTSYQQVISWPVPGGDNLWYIDGMVSSKQMWAVQCGSSTFGLVWETETSKDCLNVEEIKSVKCEVWHHLWKVVHLEHSVEDINYLGLTPLGTDQIQKAGSKS